MSERPTKLVYRGKRGVRKGDHFAGVPAQDLNEDDIRRLDAATLKEITGAHPTLGPLYAEPGAADDEEPEATTEKAEAKGKKG